MSDPAYLKALKGEMPIQKMGMFQNYYKTYIATSRFTPVVHVISGIMLIGYAMEFGFHLKHERHSAQQKRLEHGGHH